MFAKKKQQDKPSAQKPKQQNQKSKYKAKLQVALDEIKQLSDEAESFFDNIEQKYCVKESKDAD